MRRSKQTNKRRLHKSNTSGGAMVKPTPDVESGGARINPLTLAQETPVTIIRSKKKTYQLRHKAAYRKPGEAD